MVANYRYWPDSARCRVNLEVTRSDFRLETSTFGLQSFEWLLDSSIPSWVHNEFLTMLCAPRIAFCSRFVDCCEIRSPAEKRRAFMEKMLSVIITDPAEDLSCQQEEKLKILFKLRFNAVPSSSQRPARDTKRSLTWRVTTSNLLKFVQGHCSVNKSGLESRLV